MVNVWRRKLFFCRLIATSTSTEMAKSKFEYVKRFESEERCLPETWMVLRLDGRCFHKFSGDHDFKKPNDECALRLMNQCAESVMHEFSDVVLGYGQSDEFSFVFKRSTNLFKRRPSKIMTTMVSHFAACYVFHWHSFFPATKLQYPPSFDARVVTYPTLKSIRDYLSWRQVDCHVNNLYNTCFWTLVHSGVSLEDAEKKLCGTEKKDKNELLFSQFSINYNTLPQMFRKGSVLIWSQSPHQGKGEDGCVNEHVMKVGADAEAQDAKPPVRNGRGKVISILHEDIIGEPFWTEHPHILF